MPCSSDRNDTFTPPHGSTDPSDAAPLRRLLATELFAGAREVIIVHRDQEYRLRITSNDKLILTK